jgi:superfamily II DNA or RNA helicase
VAVSEDPAASDKIVRFAAGTGPWIVAVRMVSEGVDIPRLRVGVHATTTTTELFFRQAVGRIVRHTGGRGRAYMFVPDDPRLRHHATTIAESRRHHLLRDGADDETGPAPDRDREDRDDRDEQLSLFTVHSATATPQPVDPDDIFADLDEPHLGDPAASEHGADDLLIDLASLPPVGAPEPDGPGARRQERERQRRINARLARDLASMTGLDHAKVNAELNRLAGVSKVSEATIRQLEKRAAVAAEWYDRERRRSAARAANGR